MFSSTQILSSLCMTGVTFLLLLYYARKYSRRYSIKNKVILVTGACTEGGLGIKLAGLAKIYGAKTIIVTSRNENAGLKGLSFLNEVEGRGIAVHATLDLNWPHEQIEERIRQLWNKYGRIDVVIANAGVSYRGEIKKTANEVHKNLMQSNYFGNVSIFTTIMQLIDSIPKTPEEELSSEMSLDEGFYFVGITSIQGRISIPFRSAYSASKHAFSAFLDCLRAEAHSRQCKAAAEGETSESMQREVRVLNVIPGYIQTNLSRNAIRDMGDKHNQMDTTTQHGMTTDHVASEIFSSIRRGHHELVLIDMKSWLALYLRTLCSQLYFYIMRKRAASSSAY